MLVSGLWHGANWTFVFWGGYHGLLMVGNNIQRSFGFSLPESKITRIINIFFTFVLVMTGWIFFRANSIGDAFMAIDKIFTERGSLYNGAGMPAILLSLLLIGLLMLRELYVEYKWKIPFVSSVSLVRDIVFTLLLIIVIILCGQFNGGQFIYFQF